VLQLRVLSGKQAGAALLARRFPVRIGRAEHCELRLDDPGIWDQHLVLEFKPAFGFFLHTQPNTLARVNGQPVSTILLRNGDTIELGGAAIQCWLSPVRQRSLGLREAVSWFLIGSVIVAEVGVLYWLVQ
jgi:pSer/pThr/pTyr-binding forkhead associated (FHA) protein